jgi:hypothetical protein
MVFFCNSDQWNAPNFLKLYLDYAVSTYVGANVL